MNAFPCTHIAHWVSGPVYCCEHHANQIVGMGQLLGTHVHVEVAPPGNAEVCSNCRGEHERRQLMQRVLWQPIDTMPRDDTAIMARTADDVEMKWTGHLLVHAMHRDCPQHLRFDAVEWRHLTAEEIP